MNNFDVFDKYPIEKDLEYLTDNTKPEYIHINGISPIQACGILSIKEKNDLKNLLINHLHHFYKNGNNFFSSQLDMGKVLNRYHSDNIETRHISSKNHVLFSNIINGNIPRKEDKITTFEYRNTFYDLINKNNFTKNNKKQILDHIFNESKSALEIVNNSFNMEFVGQKIITMAMKTIRPILNKEEPLKSKITASIMGGCIRDFILNKENEIKDIDMVISLESYSNKEIEQLVNKNLSNKNLNYYKEIKKELEKQKKEKDNLVIMVNDLEVMNTPQPFDETNFAIILKMVGGYLLVKDKLEKTNQYQMQDNIEQILKILKKESENDIPGEYQLLEDKVFSVIKLQKNNEYPIDLIFTSLDIETYRKRLDFDICKVEFRLMDRVERLNFPKKSEELISRFKYCPNFLYDVIQKKLSYDVWVNNEKSNERSLFEHLPRMQTKYPDYELNIYQAMDGEVGLDKLNEVKVNYEYKCLNDGLKKPKISGNGKKRTKI